MTDKQSFEKDINVPSKQIIIDGVGVSGCGYIIPPRKQCPNKPMPYAKETSCFACKEHNTKLNFCKNNPNCYYKQLQRAEQKLEKIRKLLTTCQQNSEILCSECEFSEQCEIEDTDTQILKIIEEQIKDE